MKDTILGAMKDTIVSWYEKDIDINEQMNR